MKRLLYISAAIVAALCCAVTTGCNSVGCTENQNAVPLAGLYSMTTGEAIAIDSLAISGEGAPNDSLLAAPSERVSEVYLPLRSTESSTTFVIKYMQKALAQYGIEDRITFYYESTPWFDSEDCGAMYHYRITRVSHTSQLLDSVGISDSLITNVERKYIGLYFRTSSDDDDEGDDTPPGGDDDGDDEPGDNEGDNNGDATGGEEDGKKPAEGADNENA